MTIQEINKNLNKEFKNKLVEVNVFNQWCENLILSKRPAKIENLNNSEDFKDFILNSFIFIETVEGSDFWSEIANIQSK